MRVLIRSARFSSNSSDNLHLQIPYPILITCLETLNHAPPANRFAWRPDSLVQPRRSPSAFREFLSNKSAYHQSPAFSAQTAPRFNIPLHSMFLI